jgi:ribosomal small subunit protein bTHX
MGKGDKKTKRGKILMGSHGVRRARRKLGKAIPLVALKEEKPAEPIKVKPIAKPAPVIEDVPVDTPVMSAPVEEVVKPARKKAPPKGSAKKEETV